MTAVKMDVETASGTSDANPCFLGNEELSPYLRLSDCSQVSDGRAAMIVVSEEELAKPGLTARSVLRSLAGQALAIST